MECVSESGDENASQRPGLRRAFISLAQVTILTSGGSYFKKLAKAAWKSKSIVI